MMDFLEVIEGDIFYWMAMTIWFCTIVTMLCVHNNNSVNNMNHFKWFKKTFINEHKFTKLVIVIFYFGYVYIEITTPVYLQILKVLHLLSIVAAFCNLTQKCLATFLGLYQFIDRVCKNQLFRIFSGLS